MSKFENEDSDDDIFGMDVASLANAMNAAEKDDELEEQALSANLTALNTICDRFLLEVTSGSTNTSLPITNTFKDDIISDISFLESSFNSIQSGNYINLFSSDHAKELIKESNDLTLNPINIIRDRILAYIHTEDDKNLILPKAIEIVFLGIAAFNLFLQINYTGPELDDDQIPIIPIIENELNKDNNSVALLSVDGEFPYTGSDSSNLLVLSRILLSFISDPTFPIWSIPVSSSGSGGGGGGSGGELNNESNSNIGSGSDIWKCCSSDERERNKIPLTIVMTLKQIRLYSAWWCARTIVTHQRLFIAGSSSSNTLWIEFCHCFRHVLLSHCGSDDAKVSVSSSSNKDKTCFASEVWIEFGLGMFHFGRHDEGKAAFEAARRCASLHVELTGALGKRTKFQQRSLAQMMIKASTIQPEEASTIQPEEAEADKSESISKDKTISESQNEESKNNTLPHTEGQAEDSILFEHTEYDAVEDKLENEETLKGDQLAVLLALCLDVKNSNPKDGLTTEQMKPYVERVLIHPFNWTIYSTALLQRSWLDFESTYARDRATLQLQALVDQHGKTLTYTQLSRDVIESSAKVNERLRFLHSVVYPPKWELKKDLANKYQELGILVSASELYISLELWDDVVDCYSRMGKRKDALAVVQDQRKKGTPPTPRMLCSIGDLLEAPESTQYYKDAWKLSGGRYARAMRCAGREAVQLADASLSKEATIRTKLSDPNVSSVIKDTLSLDVADKHASDAIQYLEFGNECLSKSVIVQPSITSDWFVLGTIRMRLLKWQSALTCFSTVVSHEPEAGDAWGNVGAIHLRLKRPDLALTAFSEGLKHSRESWRMWENRLLSGLQIRPNPPAPDIVYAASELFDLHSRSIGRGVDTPMLAAIISAVLRHEGIDVSAGDDGSSSSKTVVLNIDDEPFTSDYFNQIQRNLLRKTGLLLSKVTGNTTKATDAKTWELFAIFNVSIGRRSAARECRMKHCRQLQTPGWEKRVNDMNAIADGVIDLVQLHSLPLGPSLLKSQQELLDNEKKQLYNLNLFVRGIITRATALGATGDPAREKLQSAKEQVELMMSSSAPAAAEPK